MSDPLDFWFPWKPALFRQDTLDLSLEHCEIYRRLIEWYMENARPLPESMNALARIVGTSSDAMSNAWSMLQAYFEHAPGIGWRNKRCDIELQIMMNQSEKRVGKAKAAASARWKKHSKSKRVKADDATSNAPGMLQAMLGDATEQYSIVEDNPPLSPPPGGRGQRLLGFLGHDADVKSPEMPVEFAMEATALHIPGRFITAAWPEFVDYWRSVPGQKGVKLDWLATWRNSLRKVYGGSNEHISAGGNGRTGQSKSERFKQQLVGAVTDDPGA